MTRRTRQDIDAFLEGGAEPMLERVLGAAEPAREPLLSGEQIGPWRLLRPIGEGGMSIVYLAERADGEYQAEVAVKLLRHPGSDSSLARRFRVERQILADLEHPHIARIIDGGVSETGWPYLVMEHVDGGTLVDWCRDLPRSERLRLFREVCEAVQHAHRHLVVHRDLKPSNILVGAGGEVKLLDFGIAKLLDEAAEATELTLPHTGTGLRLMTPEYAAPEQIRGGSITTGTDVYALGVLLYELLADRRPYDLKNAGPGRVEQLVCEIDPPAPGSGDADLDTICLKALRKEPSARYAGAGELAADLDRHARGLPVEARPATAGYRVRKFVRRNRVGVVGSALLLVTVLGFAMAMGLQSAATALARDQARAEAIRATAVTEFLLDLFRAGDPRQAGTDSLQVADLLARGLERAEALSGQPEVRSRMLVVIGRAYTRLGRYAQGEAALREGLAGTPDGADAAVLGELAENLLAQGRRDEAVGMARQALDLRLERLGPGDPATARAMSIYGSALAESGREAEAESLLTLAASILESDPGAPETDVLTALNNLADVRLKKGEFAPALELLADVLARQRRLLGDDDYEVAVTLNNLAVASRRTGDLPRAEQMYLESLAIKRRRLGDDHPDVARTLDNLGVAVGTQGRYDEAGEFMREALSIRERTLGENHPAVGLNWNNLAVLMMRKQDYAQAVACGEKAVAIRRASGATPRELVGALANLAFSYSHLGRTDDALRTADEAWRVADADLPPDHADRIVALAAVAQANLDAGRLDAAYLAAADSAQARTESLVAAVYGEHHSAMATTILRTARLRLAQGRVADAREAARTALDLRVELIGADHTRTAEAWQVWAAVQAAAGDMAAAREAAAEAIRIWTAAGQADSPAVREIEADLARWSG